MVSACVLYEYTASKICPSDAQAELHEGHDQQVEASAQPAAGDDGKEIGSASERVGANYGPGSKT